MFVELVEEGKTFRSCLRRNFHPLASLQEREDIIFFLKKVKISLLLKKDFSSSGMSGKTFRSFLRRNFHPLTSLEEREDILFFKKKMNMSYQRRAFHPLACL